MIGLARDHSPLGEVPLYGASSFTRFDSTANLANIIISASDANDTFEILTDTQVVELMFMGLYISSPDMLC